MNQAARLAGKSQACNVIPLTGLPRALLPIYLTTFVDMLGLTLLIPLLPAIAMRYGAQDWMVGMLLSVPAALATVAAPAWGKASDRTGRKFIIVAAQFFTLAGYVLLAVAGSFFWILISRIISGIGAGSVGTAQSYVADVTRKSQREQAYAIYGAVFGAAFVVGPVMAGFLQRRGLQFPFFFAVVLELLNICLTLWLLPTSPTHRETTIRESALAAWRPLIRRVLVRQFLFVFAVVYLLADFALYLHHWLRLDTATVSWLLAITGIIGGITMVSGVAPLSRRFGDRQVAQFGLALLFIAYALIYFVRDVVGFFGVLVLWTVGATMVEPTLMAMLSRRAPSEERGAIMGISDGVNSAALILAPAIGTAIVGYDARVIGMLPAVAVGVAWVIGRKPIEPRAARHLH